MNGSPTPLPALRLGRTLAILLCGLLLPSVSRAAAAEGPMPPPEPPAVERAAPAEPEAIALTLPERREVQARMRTMRAQPPVIVIDEPTATDSCGYLGTEASPVIEGWGPTEVEQANATSDALRAGAKAVAQGLMDIVEGERREPRFSGTAGVGRTRAHIGLSGRF